MIAIDTSSLRRWAEGETGQDVDQVAAAIDSGEGTLPPAVVTEALSKAVLPEAFIHVVATLPVVPLRYGYWFRAGELRADAMRRGFKSETRGCADRAGMHRPRSFAHHLRRGLPSLHARRSEARVAARFCIQTMMP